MHQQQVQRARSENVITEQRREKGREGKERRGGRGRRGERGEGRVKQELVV